MRLAPLLLLLFAALVLAALDLRLELPSGRPQGTAVGWLCAVMCQRGADYHVSGVDHGGPGQVRKISTGRKKDRDGKRS